MSSSYEYLPCDCDTCCALLFRLNENTEEHWELISHLVIRRSKTNFYLHIQKICSLDYDRSILIRQRNHQNIRTSRKEPRIYLAELQE